MSGVSPTLMLNTLTPGYICHERGVVWRGEGKTACLTVASSGPIFIHLPVGRSNVGCGWYDTDSRKRILTAPCLVQVAHIMH